MPSNIYTPNDYKKILDRISSLKPSSRARWGKMSLPQMLEHCSIQLRIGLGEIPQSGFEGLRLYRTKFGRWVSLYTFPWPRGFATPSKMNIIKNKVDVNDFEEARGQLEGLLEKIIGEDQLNHHPFFGEMDKKDWGRLIWKHLDHHLRQFGA